MECDHGLIHCDEQLSRQRKSKNPSAETVLEEKFLQCISWEFVPLTEAHFYSLSSHHMSLPDLLGTSAQPKYDTGGFVFETVLSACTKA